MNAQPDSDALALTTAAAGNPATAQALLRLRSSRQRLRDHWIPAPAAGGGASARVSLRFGGLAGLWRHWRRRLHRLPGADAVALALGTWWQSHPWRTTAELVQAELLPRTAAAMRRHPLASVGVAAVLGYAVVSFRPWRSGWCRRQLDQLPHHIGHTLWSVAGQVPLHAVLAGVLGAATVAADARPAPDSTEVPDAR
jgi:hypothetical protein